MKNQSPVTSHPLPQEAKFLAQGAEAKIFLSDEIVTKNRIQKSYRHPQLDLKIEHAEQKAKLKF